MEAMMSSSVLSPPAPPLVRWAGNPLPSQSCRSSLMTRREKFQAAVVASLNEKKTKKNHSFSSHKTKEVRENVVVAGVSIAVAFAVALTSVDSASARSGEIDLPPVEPEVVAVSSAKEIGLAKQLQTIGAKMYGAFWCSHCFEQKQMFGKEALKYIEYVECYPEGYRRGVKLAPACSAANIRGFPTWVINGQQYSGEQGFDKLAELSGLSVAPTMK